MPIDVAIPYQPRQVGQAATMGTPACMASGGFRNGVLALAREVAFVADGTPSASGGKASSGGGPFGLGRIIDKLSGRSE